MSEESRSCLRLGKLYAGGGCHCYSWVLVDNRASKVEVTVKRLVDFVSPAFPHPGLCWQVDWVPYWCLLSTIVFHEEYHMLSHSLALSLCRRVGQSWCTFPGIDWLKNRSGDTHEVCQPALLQLPVYLSTPQFLLLTCDIFLMSLKWSGKTFPDYSFLQKNQSHL